jgi:hypothetical protein
MTVTYLSLVQRNVRAQENYLLLPALAASRVDLLALLGRAEHMPAS